MKKWNYLLMAMGVAMTLSACTDETDLAAGNGMNTTEDVDQVFMQFKLGLPTASRSQTEADGGSNAGVEIGKDYENKVSNVLVVITNAEKGDNYDKYITQSYVSTPAAASDNMYVVPFSSTALANYANKQVNVYVICNPTEDIYPTTTGTSTTPTAFDVNGIQTLESATDESLWTNNKFLMTNADDDYTITMPANFNNYKVESNPFNIGTINVERAAARFDYKSSVANETYTLMGEDNDPEVTVTLTHMALVNMSKECYYLRRVSADGTASNVTIGGIEVGGTNANYVVDTDADWKSSYSGSGASDHFYYVYTPNDITTPNYEWTEIADVTGATGTEDNDKDWNNTNDANKQGYKIWRYATENTIPGAENQEKGITTGVVFKGELKAVKDGAVKTAMDAHSTVYVYNDIMYGTWENVKTAATADNPTLKVAYDQVGSTENKSNAVAAGFTVFEPTDGKYEVLYYYWNRHNDNSQDGVMGPMEFAVVRNNVYKLSVTGVHKFGHPTEEENDPDPEDPDDPDESSNVYFSVTAKVLPWVVRINNIKF